jgi:hypothetical protein
LQFKALYPDEERAIITATPQIPYELLVSTMDAMRQSAGDRQRSQSCFPVCFSARG